MKTTDIPHLRGEVMPEAKDKQPAKTEPAPKPVESTPGLTPAGESGNPEVQQLLAELATARANSANDDAQDIVDYLAQLGFSA